MRASAKGSALQKAEQKKDISSKCEDPAHKIWWNSDEGPLGKWSKMSLREKQAVTAEFVLKVVSKVHEQGFHMREVRGVFWPKSVYELFWKKQLHPTEVQNIRGMDGVVMAKDPSQVLPLGVFELFNDTKDYARETTDLESSDAARSNLMPGQLASTYQNLSAAATSNAVENFTMREGAPEKIPDVVLTEEEKKAAAAAAPKRKKGTKALSDSDDDWFCSVPRDGEQPSGRKKSRGSGSGGGGGGRGNAGGGGGGGGGGRGLVLICVDFFWGLVRRPDGCKFVFGHLRM